VSAGRSTNDVNGACDCPASTATSKVSSLWWLMLLLLLAVPAPMVVAVVVWRKSVMRQRQVDAVSDQPQPAGRTSAYMTDSN